VALDLHRPFGPARTWLPGIGRLTQADLPLYGPLALGGLGHHGSRISLE
jgi:hypothetical protein